MTSYLDHENKAHRTESQGPDLSPEQVPGHDMGAGMTSETPGDDFSNPGRGQVAETGSGAQARPTNRNVGSVEHGSKKA